MTKIRFTQAVEAAIDKAALATGIDRDFLRAIAHIESSGNPRKSTGQYKGLFMLSNEAFKKHGGRGSIFNPDANALAGAKKFLYDKRNFARRKGREPTLAELYLSHQQGVSGALAHLSDPERAAWASMYSTLEGRKRGAAWSKRAIWGNLTQNAKNKFKTVENVTSGDFAQFWKDRYHTVREQLA